MQRSAKTDLRKGSCMESPGWVGLQGGGGVWAFGWLDGSGWGEGYGVPAPIAADGGGCQLRMT